MDASPPAGSPWRSAISPLNTLCAMMLLALASLGLGSACTPTINIESNAKVSQTQGKSLSINCPVKLCSQERPTVTWCKIKGQHCEPIEPNNRISTEWEYKKIENQAVHFLKFHSVQKNDTGFYKCSATYNKEQIVGRAIEITLSDAAIAETTTMNMSSNNTNSTLIPTILALEQFKILMYVMASAGGLCLMIITISLLVFCQRRRRGKHGPSTDPETAEEVQFVATAASHENCLEHSKASCPLAKEITTIETTYDNAQLDYQPSLPLSPEEDSIVYADLNHEAKKAHIQYDKEHEVEYATVRLK